LKLHIDSFVNGTLNGTPVSTTPFYQFTMDGNKALVANFSLQFAVVLASNPAEGGSTTGGGLFTASANATVTVTPNTGYTFSNWTEGLTIASTDASYAFQVNASKTLVANFAAIFADTYTLNVATIRAGLALKFGHGRKIADKVVYAPPIVAVVVEPDVTFEVNAPKNAPVERRVRETFPLRNYVFFSEGSTEIPARYVFLQKNQVKDFREDQLEVFTPKELTGRSKRQMTVYYNVLNILGDRMVKKSHFNSNHDRIVNGRCF